MDWLLSPGAALQDIKSKRKANLLGVRIEIGIVAQAGHGRASNDDPVIDHRSSEEAAAMVVE
ncbi:hypothetical protein [Bradyrhizobium sp. ARR65]|uniref:hypothetical protein n=1 Tax=Bradyrhizobium sp. ARR65 TaxID=1040989 RepID=UPI00046709D2|nr:hypothetical protein [Bradyrhizobium sp. ARR65]